MFIKFVMNMSQKNVHNQDIKKLGKTLLELKNVLKIHLKVKETSIPMTIES